MRSYIFEGLLSMRLLLCSQCARTFLYRRRLRWDLPLENSVFGGNIEMAWIICKVTGLEQKFSMLPYALNAVANRFLNGSSRFPISLQILEVTLPQ